MECPGEHFLAGARFAGDQHAGIARRDQLGFVEQTVHQRRAGDDARTPDLLPVLTADAGLFKRLVDACQQHILVHRLGQKIQRAALGGRHGLGDGAVGGQQDDRQVGMGMAQAFEQGHAVHLVHAQIGDYAIRAVIIQCTQCGQTAFRGFDMMSGAFQTQREQPAQAGVVVDQQDLAAARHLRCGLAETRLDFRQFPQFAAGIMEFALEFANMGALLGAGVLR